MSEQCLGRPTPAQANLVPMVSANPVASGPTIFFTVAQGADYFP